MNYKFHEGIVYSKVSGVHLLIATRSVWDKFPAAKRLSALQGCFCYGIEHNMSEDELIDFLILPPRMTKDTVRKAYHRFIGNMVREGYLVDGGVSDDS